MELRKLKRLKEELGELAQQGGWVVVEGGRAVCMAYLGGAPECKRGGH